LEARVRRPLQAVEKRAEDLAVDRAAGACRLEVPAFVEPEVADVEIRRAGAGEQFEHPADVIGVHVGDHEQLEPTSSAGGGWDTVEAPPHDGCRRRDAGVDQYVVDLGSVPILHPERIALVGGE